MVWGVDLSKDPTASCRLLGSVLQRRARNMTELKIEFDAKLKCPYCGSTSVDCDHAYELDYDGSGVCLFGESELVSEIAKNRLRDDDLLDEKGCFRDNDSLVLGYCDSCGRVFKLGMYSLDSAMFLPGQKKNTQERANVLSEVTHHVAFNEVGIPQSLVILATEITFTDVRFIPVVSNTEFEPGELTEDSGVSISPPKIEVSPLPAESLDPLFDKPPFGKYVIHTLNGRFSLWVQPYRDFDFYSSLNRPRLTQVGPLSIETSISSSDGYFMKYIESIARSSSVPPNRQSSRIHTQPIDIKYLLTASYTNVYDAETSMRKKIWTVLEDKYGAGSQFWWKSILSSGIRQRIVERANKSLDAEFENSPPDSYLTLGECKEILTERWEKDFSKVLQRRDFILSSLKELEDLRNDVAHFRVFSFDKYETVRALCLKLSRLFD
jgi:hypothetical protein